MRIEYDDVDIVMTISSLGDNASSYIRTVFDEIVGNRNKYILPGNSQKVEILNNENKRSNCLIWN